jgi:hypothetical protein
MMLIPHISVVNAVDDAEFHSQVPDSVEHLARPKDTDSP